MDGSRAPMGRRRGTVGLGGGRKGRQPKRGGSLWELEKAGNQLSPRVSRKNPALRIHFRFLPSRVVERLYLCGFKSPSMW